MALKLLQPGKDPLSFDGYDSELTSLLGGEVCRLTQVAYTYPPGASADHAAFDCFMGNSGTDVPVVRPVVSISLPATGGSSTYRPLFLVDEGTSGYGVMFGVVVGSAVGQSVPNPSNLTGVTNLGPHTTAGSGKVTCWDKPGLYAVTLDAVEATVTTAVNVHPGDALYVNTAGKLTLTSGNAFDTGVLGSETIVGRFVQFSTNGSLVTTPSFLTSTTGALALTQMEFHFRIEN